MPPAYPVYEPRRSGRKMVLGLSYFNKILLLIAKHFKFCNIDSIIHFNPASYRNQRRQFIAGGENVSVKLFELGQNKPAVI